LEEQPYYDGLPALTLIIYVASAAHKSRMIVGPDAATQHNFQRNINAPFHEPDKPDFRLATDRAE
jgi:hypothetical protein